MSLIKDFDKYMIGVEISDKHHRNLLDIINDLYDSLLKGLNKEIMSHHLKRLHVFTLAHFKAEEELMASVNYPELLEHKNIHHEFVEKLSEFKKLNGLKPIGKDLISYLVKWLTEHMLGADKKYANFIKMKENSKD